MADFYLLPDDSRLGSTKHPPKLLGQKPPLKPKEVWAIRIRLQIKAKERDLALFNLAIDRKLRSCDLVALRASLEAEAVAVLRRLEDLDAPVQEPAEGSARGGLARDEA